MLGSVSCSKCDELAKVEVTAETLNNTVWEGAEYVFYEERLDFKSDIQLIFGGDGTGRIVSREQKMSESFHYQASKDVLEIIYTSSNKRMYYRIKEHTGRRLVLEETISLEGEDTRLTRLILRRS